MLSTSPCEQPPPPPPPPEARGSYRMSSSVLPFSLSHLLCFGILPRVPKVMWNPAPQPKGSLGQRSQRARNHSGGEASPHLLPKVPGCAPPATPETTSPLLRRGRPGSVCLPLGPCSPVLVWEGQSCRWALTPSPTSPRAPFEGLST